MTFSYSRYNPKIKLSAEEIFEISQEINQEFAPNFSLKKPEPVAQHSLSPKEMLDISEEIRIDFAPKASSNTQELVLLPVDPDHLYAYWNVADSQPFTTTKINSENPLTLRVYSEPNKNMNIFDAKSWFDVAIDSAQAQQKVFLPIRANETTYSATIGSRYPDNSLASFVTSNIAQLPLGKLLPNPAKENQIVFKSMPELSTANREISICANSSTSGQGNN